MNRRIALGILVLATALAPAAAGAEELGRFSARAEAGGSIGVADAGVGGFAARGSLAWRPVLLEASLDVGGYIRGAPRSSDLSLLGGAGVSFPAASRWRGAVLLVAGLHAFGTEEADGPGYQDHALPAVGFRAGVTLQPARRRLFFPSVTLAATATADLRREYDVFLGREVGGFTLLVSATAGVGFAP